MNKTLAIAGVVVVEMIRRKDVYVLWILTVVITLLLGSVNMFGDPGIARYLKEACLSLIWLCSVVISASTAARKIPMERESRTIFPLLAKPVTRLQVVLGKFLGCWVASGMSLVLFYSFFCVVSGSREQQWPLINYAQALWLHTLFCGVVVAMAILGSVLFTSVAANMTIVMVSVFSILFLGRHLHKVASRTEGVGGVLLDGIYYGIPHLEWYDVRELIIHNWPRLDWGLIGFDTLYGFAYCLLFLLLAWGRFRRQPLTA